MSAPTPAVVPVILCGGSGTRLWPLSRAAYPKQFLTLGRHSLFAETVSRALAVPGSGKPLVVCNEGQRFLAAAALQQLDAQATILLEHVGRNTAPAIAIAALAALETGEDPFLLVLPADHLIDPQDAFVDAITEGLRAAANGSLVTFGVTPLGPETGFGYIHHGPALTHGRAIASFEEKPCLERAEQLFAQGGCSWNSGIFLFRASSFLEELTLHSPDIAHAARELWNSRRPDLDFVRFAPELFETCPQNSIDYAVMEHTTRGVVVPLAAKWSDLGSWDAVLEASSQDELGNASIGDVILEDVSGSYIHSQGRLVAALGLTDMVVVETPDAVLVSSKKRAQDIKAIIARLQAEGRQETEHHIKVHRPWGNYQSLVTGERFQVKRIEVSPGAALSLQRHHHRAEHWVVVSGTAHITRGEEELVLTEDMSTYIPLATVHRLRNPGRIPLVIIEIQTGSYLGEDDIVRLEDVYGRENEGEHG